MTISDDPQADPTKSSVAFKKMRMTLACVRCRFLPVTNPLFFYLPIVRCDYAHPSCTRCSQAKASCSYEGSSTQVDLFNIVKLNDIVGTLQQRVQSLESTLGDIHHTTQTATDNLNGKDPAEMTTTPPTAAITTLTHSSTSSTAKLHNQHQWSLSLTPTGLRIDTNFVSLPNLYDILLSGISQLDMEQEPTVADEAGNSSIKFSPSTFDRPQPLDQQIRQQQQLSIMVTRKSPLWRSKCATFPLYSSWSSINSSKGYDQTSPPSTDDIHHGDHHSHKRNIMTTSVLDTMIDIYNECFLCLPETGHDGTIGDRYHQGTLDPLLANAIFAWSARHGAIYHDLFTGQDPNEVGECYFAVAKDLLKDRFMIPTMDTLHGLLMLYVYATGRPSKSNGQQSRKDSNNNNAMESEAYIFLGLAIRMCMDLKLHKENPATLDGCSNNDNLMQDGSSNRRMLQERHRRFFWVLYFLETLCSLHSDRPFSLPCEDQITVAYPDMLGDELGERRWRTEFMMKRFRITRIYRDIIQRTAHERLLLSTISELDASLCEWYEQLPSHLQYNQGDHLQPRWTSTSFREQACLKLNFEYQFQRCQLYAVFLKQQQQQQDNGLKSTDLCNGDDDGDDGQGNIASSAIELKAKEVCLTATTLTIELMQCWNQLQQRWCHFSLDPLMMTVNIFEILVKDENYVDLVKDRLATMFNILQASPIHHHRYVVLLMARIRQLVQPTHKTDDEPLVKTTHGQPPRVELENRAEQQYNQHIQHHYDQQLQSYGSSYQQSVDFYNGSRFQKLDGMMDIDFCDLPFSDFLYNPVMETTSHIGSYNTDGIETTPSAFCLPNATPTTTGLSISASTSRESFTDTTPPPSKRISPPLTAHPPSHQSKFSTLESPLWTTLHQSAYVSNELVDFEYVPRPMSLQQQQVPSQLANGQHYHSTSPP
ncbi:hypothetical protein BC941DRAFT_418613 [Chlamydoabsidia padenii]|nr:hypothetical protein BC941DRAFT_418613 [Chlamydoabsidia padenii]